MFGNRNCLARPRFVAVLATGLFLLPLAGCGSPSEGPPTYPVRGSLFVDGAPAKDAQVILHPAGGKDFDKRGARPTGIVGADGSFKLTTYQPGDGAPAGRYVVTVYWAEKPASLEPSDDRMGGKFLDPKQSKLEVEVLKSATELSPLKLATK